MAFDYLTEGHGFDSTRVPFYVSMFRARQKLSTKKSTWPTGEFKTKDLWSCSFSGGNSCQPNISLARIQLARPFSGPKFVQAEDPLY